MKFFLQELNLFFGKKNGDQVIGELQKSLKAIVLLCAIIMLLN